MIEPEDTGVGPGHNNPPSPIEEARAAQRDGQEQYEDRRDEIIAAADAKQVTDKVSAGEAADILRVCKLFADKLEAERAERSRPYRDASDAIMAIHRDFIESLHAAERQLHLRLDAWRREEKQRAKRQQDEQAAVLGDVASGPVDTSPTQQPPRQDSKGIVARGDYGAKAVDTTVTTYTVTDVRAVPDHILNTPTVHDAIIKVVKSGAKHFPDVPGVTKSTTEKVRVR